MEVSHARKKWKVMGGWYPCVETQGLCAALDNIIKENLEGCWNYNRIAKIDLAILRVAVNEIYYLDDIPESVAINEAIEIANKYSTDASYKFINGILGTIVRAKK